MAGNTKRVFYVKYLAAPDYADMRFPLVFCG